MAKKFILLTVALFFFGISFLIQSPRHLQLLATLFALSDHPFFGWMTLFLNIILYLIGVALVLIAILIGKNEIAYRHPINITLLLVLILSLMYFFAVIIPGVSVTSN